MNYTCPVCGFPDLDGPPTAYLICQCCGTEFDYHDSKLSHRELRKRWIDAGCPWHSKRRAPPIGWSAGEQLTTAGFDAVAPLKV